MSDSIYEIRISGVDMKIDKDVWKQIARYARENKFFLIEYMEKYYKYKKDQEFFDRPTRFDFELVTPEDMNIGIIHIE